MSFPIAYYDSISIAKPSLITHKDEPPRTSLYIFHLDQPPSFLFNSTLKNMFRHFCILGNSKYTTISKWPFSSTIYQFQQSTNKKDKQANTKWASRKQGRMKKGNIERASTGI